MPSDETRTLTLPMDAAMLRPKRKGLVVESPAGTLTLHIRGVNIRLALEHVQRLVLGRVDAERGVAPDVDLAPYGAAERGVSRAHLMLHFENRRLIATDLSSANGTLLNGHRLNATSPHEVRDRDELTLGRLTISVRLALEAAEYE
jgi:pSer/pThr/pTyr-binding forkhead associated (FHA) protein